MRSKLFEQNNIENFGDSSDESTLFKINNSDRKKEKAYQEVKNRLGFVFDQFNSGQERIDNVKSKISVISRYFLTAEQQKNVELELEKCFEIQNKQKFIDNVFKIIKPIISLKFEKPEEFDEIRRDDFKKRTGFVEVNKLLSYEINNEILHIHIPPNESTSLQEKYSLFIKGMKELAKIVDNNKSITKIVGISWIIAKHPKILKRCGFTVDGPIDAEIKRRDFGNDEVDVWGAHMSREEFLKKYL